METQAGRRPADPGKDLGHLLLAEGRGLPTATDTK